MIIVLTGRPGVGKTTVFTKVVEDIRRHGYVVGGIVCPEFRVEGVRSGFKIVDIMEGAEGWLARTSPNCPNDLRVGKYCINVSDAVSIGVKALTNAAINADVICIDEIGPMELRVRQLRDAIIYVLRNPKNVLAVTHWRLSDSEVGELLRNAVRYEVTLVNRNSLPGIVASRLLGSLGRE